MWHYQGGGGLVGVPPLGKPLVHGIPATSRRPNRAARPDLYSNDGPKGWITKLNALERATEWLTDFAEKTHCPGVEDYQSLELTVAGYPARAIVYRDEQGWHSEVVVNLGKDLGNETYPMYAAYLYFTGETYMLVWSDEIQDQTTSSAKLVWTDNAEDLTNVTTDDVKIVITNIQFQKKSNIELKNDSGENLNNIVSKVMINTTADGVEITNLGVDFNLIASKEYTMTVTAGSSVGDNDIKVVLKNGSTEIAFGTIPANTAANTELTFTFTAPADLAATATIEKGA